MKKSILLSSIMAIVLVIALSTATFAWYGASTQVTANVNTIEAVSGDGDLQISTSANSGWGATAKDEITGPYEPGSVKALGTDETFTLEHLTSETNWVRGTKNPDGTTNKLSYTDGTNVGKVRVISNFYIKNAGATAVTVEPSFPEGAAFKAAKDNDLASTNLEDDMKYAIFYTKGSTTTLLCNTAFNYTKAVGTEISDAAAKGDQQAVKNLVAKASATAEKPATTFTVEPATDTNTNAVLITVVSWIDGWEATSDAAQNSQSGQVNFKMQFDIVK